MSEEKASTKTLKLKTGAKIYAEIFQESSNQKMHILEKQKYIQVEGLVAELEKRIDQAKEDLNSANFNWDEKSELKGKIVAYEKVLGLLGAKETKKE